MKTEKGRKKLLLREGYVEEQFAENPVHAPASQSAEEEGKKKPKSKSYLPNANLAGVEGVS